MARWCALMRGGVKRQTAKSNAQEPEARSCQELEYIDFLRRTWAPGPGPRPPAGHCPPHVSLSRSVEHIDPTLAVANHINIYSNIWSAGAAPAPTFPPNFPHFAQQRQSAAQQRRAEVAEPPHMQASVTAPPPRAPRALAACSKQHTCCIIDCLLPALSPSEGLVAAPI
jgi:hypothetical protein